MLRLALACLLLGLVVVPAAEAAGTAEILRDCADDGVLQGDYTPSELRRARRNIPADTDEYTDCRDVLARAASRGVSGGSGGGAAGGGAGGGGSSGGGGLLTPGSDEERSALSDALGRGGEARDVGGRPVVPGSAGFAAGAVRNELPVTLLVLLCLLALAALAATAPQARRVGLARASAVAGYVRGHGLRRR
jgi:hypothetical protein